MMTRVGVFLVTVSICYACGTAESGSENDLIAGTYVREYSTEILNQLSGRKMGMRTIRDTLFVSEAADGYKISNSKWRMNDYDNDGWRNMEHAESGPLPSFEATYNKSESTLNARVTGIAPELFIDRDGKILVGKKAKVPFTRVDS
jgi:hypothetical protein